MESLTDRADQLSPLPTPGAKQDSIRVYTGLEELYAGLKEAPDIASIAKISLDFMEGHLNIQLGNFYSLSDTEYKLESFFGSSANTAGLTLVLQYPANDSVVLKKILLEQERPDACFKMSVHSIAENPDSLIRIPLIYNTERFGILHLAKSGEFTLAEIRLIEVVRHSIAGSLLLLRLKLQVTKQSCLLSEKQKEIKNRRLAINSCYGILEFDLDGTILFANKFFCTLWGYTKNELIGNHHNLLVDKEEVMRPAYSDFWKKIVQGEFASGEFKRILKSGETIWIQGNYTLIRDEHGKPHKILKILSEITKAKNLQFELAQQIDSLNNAAIVSETDAKGDITFVNELFCTISEYSKEELIGRNHRLLKSGLQPDSLFSDMWKRISSGKIWKGEIVNRKKNGAYYWVDATIVPFRNSSGKIFKYVGIRFDITQLKMAKLALQENFKFTEGILSSLNSHIAVIDHRGTIISVNDAWEHFAYENGEVNLERTSVGSNYFQVCEKAIASGDKYAEKALAMIKSVLKKETKRVEMEYPCHSPEKERWFILNVTGFEGDDQKAVIHHIDISERKKAEQELIQSKLKIRGFANHVNKVLEDERTSLAREIHDELGQQLAGIKFGISSLKNKLTQDESTGAKIRDLLNDVDETIQNLRKIATELRPGILDTLGLPASIQWLVNEYQKKTKMLITLEISLEEKFFEKEISTCFFRICQEALTNISKHSGATEVYVQLDYSEKHLELLVKDNGKGILKSTIENPFSMGLLGMKERILHIGGSLKITSDFNQGVLIHAEVQMK